MTENFNDNNIEETLEASETNEVSSDLEKNDISLTEAKVDVQEEFAVENENLDGMISVRPVKFQEFESAELNLSPKRNLDILQDIPMHVSVELGKTKLSIKEVMDFQHGTVLELDKIAGEQVEIYINKKLVAKGEVIVIEDKFGVRIVSTNLPKANI